MSRDVLIEAIERTLRGEESAVPAEPWLAWLLICLCRQRTRQTWLMTVSREHLSGVDQQQGQVPGLTGWSYLYHGIGLCLSGPGGEELDMNFHDEQGAVIDPYFFAHRVMDLEPSPLPEARLRRWLPGAKVIVAGLDELRRRSIIGHPDSDHIFQLCEELEQIHQDVATLDFTEVDVQRRWARGLGDDELSGQDPGQLRGRHRAWLLDLLADRDQAGGVLKAAVETLPGQEPAALLARVAQGPVDNSMARSFELLYERGDAPPLDARKLLERLNPEEHHPYPAWATVRYFLCRNIERELCLKTLLAFAAQRVVKGYLGNPYDDKLTELMLEYAPERALPLVKQTLRSTTPCAVGGLAALLALMDQTWCHRELASALRETTKTAPENARYLVAAMGLSSSEVARRRARILAPRDPEPAPGTGGYTLEEVMANSAECLLDGYLEEARPLAEKLREFIPDDLGSER